jgi:hypothetical protein
MTDDTNKDIRGIFVKANGGDYYGPFATVDAASAFARTRTDAHVCRLDLYPSSSLELTPEEFERKYGEQPQLIFIDPPIL